MTSFVFCTVAVYRRAVSRGESDTASKKRGAKATRNTQPRASITFPPEMYKTIEELAKRKKVSIAWVVREAVEKYVADQWPLFGSSRGI
jgi:Ribbon-helix-helix protein, copG family